MGYNLKKTLEISSLFHFYKPLLTKKQSVYLEYYIDENLSLQEIADHFGVSRNAVYDSIQKAIGILENLEEKLHLKQNKIQIQNLIDKYENTNNVEVQAILKALKEE